MKRFMIDVAWAVMRWTACACLAWSGLVMAHG